MYKTTNILGGRNLANGGYKSTNYAQKSNKYVVIDIEVIPEKFENDQIKEYLMDKNFPRKMHPLFSRILMIGYKFVDEKTELLYPKDEKELLTRFWTKMREQKPKVVVTFNGYNFDIPFIQTRSYIKRVKPTIDINQNKWKIENSNHFDCMQILSSNQTFLNVALEISCQIFGLDVPEKRISGEMVPKLYDAGELDIIKEHCQQDIELTEQLYLKLKG